MIFRIPQLIQHVSSIMTLEQGDLILTGTPSGVGPIHPGDQIVAGLTQDNVELQTWEGDVRERDGGYVFSA